MTTWMRIGAVEQDMQLLKVQNIHGLGEEHPHFFKENTQVGEPPYDGWPVDSRCPFCTV